MGIGVNLLASVAASALFYVIEPYLTAQSETFRWIGSGAVFLLSMGVAWYLHKKSIAAPASKGRFLSENEVGEDFDIDMENADAIMSSEHDVLSGNKVRRDVKVRIKNTKY